jgi:hypothetical protein
MEDTRGRYQARSAAQWHEGISLVSGRRSPVPGWRSTRYAFRTRPTEAYERLLHDAMAGAARDLIAPRTWRPG